MTNKPTLKNERFASWTVHAKTPLTIQRSCAGLALVVFVWLAAPTARASDPTRTAVIGGSSSHQTSVVNNSVTNQMSNQPSKAGTIPGLVESNGLYSIDIKMVPAVQAVATGSSKVERPQESVPASMNRPIDMAQMLLIYAEFTGAELDASESVRRIPGYIPLKSTPPMTRIQVVDLFDDLLLKEGVVVTHLDAKHAVFRLEQ